MLQRNEISDRMALPKPITLTPDQLTNVAAGTAGALPAGWLQAVIAGGLPVGPVWEGLAGGFAGAI
jgi:hypothetical protein